MRAALRLVAPRLVGLRDVWSAVACAVVAKQRQGGCGSSKDGIYSGGDNVVAGATTSGEKFDNVAWATQAAMSIDRFSLSGAGVPTAALMTGGRQGSGTPILSSCEKSDGSTFSSTGALGSVVCQHGACGTQASALVFGGSTNAVNSGSTTSTQVFAIPTWSAGGAMLVGRRGICGVGSVNDAFAWGGGDTSGVYNGGTAVYLGNVWAAGPTFLTDVNSAAAGGPAASLAFNETGLFTYFCNRTAWSTRAARSITDRADGVGFGSDTGALTAGGLLGPAYTARLSLAEQYQ